MRSWSDGGKRLLGAGKFSKRPLVRLHLRSLQGGKEKANNFTVLSQRQLIPVIPSGRVGMGAAPDERARHGRGTSWLFPFGLIPTSCLPSTHPPTHSWAIRHPMHREIRIKTQANFGHSLAVQWLGLLASTERGTGSIPGWGIKIPHAVWQGRKKKTNQAILMTHEPRS